MNGCSGYETEGGLGHGIRRALPPKLFDVLGVRPPRPSAYGAAYSGVIGKLVSAVGSRGELIGEDIPLTARRGLEAFFAVAGFIEAHGCLVG